MKSWSKSTKIWVSNMSGVLTIVDYVHYWTTAGRLSNRNYYVMWDKVKGIKKNGGGEYF